MAHEALPYAGRRFSSPKKRFEEVIVFVHQYGGHRGSVRKHQEMVADLGFDSVAFNLSFNQKRIPEKLPVTSELEWGIRHVWAEEIEAVLSSLPGQKIVYSFSMPSSAALEAIVNRKAVDVRGWICDGGPFFQWTRCFWNYFTYAKRVRNPLTRAARVAASFALLRGTTYEEEVRSNLRNLPARFPILNIRGWQDRLVPVSAIDEVFAGINSVQLEIVSLPEGDHLDGLFRFRDEYVPRVEKFLTSLCQEASIPGAKEEEHTPHPAKPADQSPQT